MKTALLIFTIFLINGCVEPKPCVAVPCAKQECKFPKLPTYKAPIAKRFPAPKDIGHGDINISKESLIDVFETNKKLRSIVWKYTKVNILVNKEYQK